MSAAIVKTLLIAGLTLAIGYMIILNMVQRSPSKALCTGFAVCRVFGDSRRYKDLTSAQVDRTLYLNDSELHTFWTSNPDDPDQWTSEEWRRREVPSYVLQHAPYVHLNSRERFWPGDIAQHLGHATLFSNQTALAGDLAGGAGANELPRFQNLDEGDSVFLHADYDVETPQDWLSGIRNVPRPILANGEDEEEEQGATRGLADGVCRSIFGFDGGGAKYCDDFCDASMNDCHNTMRFLRKPHSELKKRSQYQDSTTIHPIIPGRSSAPAILLVVPKDNGIVDAFWFFFYSFNLGPTFLGTRFGNHGGDWEHTLIRFKYGQPILMSLSAHNFASAYTWAALEKYQINSTCLTSSWANSTIRKDVFDRPVVYSALGTHAMYPIAGEHPFPQAPLALLRDQADRGPLWDPSLNVKSYLYDHKTETLRPSTHNPKAPTGWFHFAGRWGSDALADSDWRQYSVLTEPHFKLGPRGPKFKWLWRQQICGGNRRKCPVKRVAAVT